jgi:hypothetical protein
LNEQKALIEMDSPDRDENDLDEVFRTFREDSESDEDRSAPVPAPRKPTPNAGSSAIALPEPDDEGD